ncbi:hypothetical protein NHX12_008130, partial [Muraenolepis orangiensis]
MISLCGSPVAAILDDPMEDPLMAITLAKDRINRSNRSTTGKLEVDIFELLET